jgi:plasmid stability protein
MRTTFDLPDELMRHLKARAALEGRSLRELVERGLKAPPAPKPPTCGWSASTPTSPASR